MANVKLGAGLILLVFGLGAFTGFIPLSGTGAIGAYSSVTINCDTQTNCLINVVISDPYSLASNQEIAVDVGIAQYLPASPIRCNGVGFPYCTTDYMVLGPFNPVGAISQSLTTGNIYTGNNFVPGRTYYVVICGGLIGSSDYQNCLIGNVGASFVYPSAGSTTTTTTTFSSGIVPFEIQYDSSIQVASISPPSTTGPIICQASCPGGLNSYTGSWALGTSIQVTVNFANTELVQVCTNYSNQAIGSPPSCFSVTSGVPFTATVYAPFTNNVPSGLTYEVVGSTFQNPVVITSCIAAPNPCNSQAATGSWNPATSILSSSTSTASFTFTPGAGYSCNGNWYLWSLQSNRMVTSGGGAQNGIQFNWNQFQGQGGWESQYGTAYDLVSGTLTNTGCTAMTSTLSVQWSSPIVNVVCSGGPFAGNSIICPGTTTITGPTSVTFSVGCPTYSCTFTGWTVNGQSFGSSQTITVPLNPSQNWIVVANGQPASGQGACTLNPITNAGIALTLINSKTGTAVGGAFVSVLANGVTLATGTTNAQGVVALCNFAVPGGLAGLTGSGTVTIKVQNSGYQSLSQDVTVTQGQVSTVILQIAPNNNSIGGFGTGQVIGLVSMLGGGGLIFLGVRKRR